MEDVAVIAEQAKSLQNSAKELEAKLHESLQAYIDFLVEEEPNSAYLVYPENVNAHREVFQIVASQAAVSDKGIAFQSQFSDNPNLLILPYGFIRNPEAWKRELLEKIASDEPIARKVFEATATGAGGPSKSGYRKIYSFFRSKNTDNTPAIGVYVFDGTQPLPAKRVERYFVTLENGKVYKANGKEDSWDTESGPVAVIENS